MSMGLGLTLGLSSKASGFALPTLPIANGAKVALMGHHSISASNFTDQSGNHGLAVRTYGIMAWVRAMDDRFNCDTFFSANDPYGRTAGDVPTYTAGEGYDGANQAMECNTMVGPLTNVPATNIPGSIAQTPYTLARAPKIIFFQGVENDIQGGQSSAQIIASLDTQLSMFTNAGVWVILPTLQPSWPSWSAGQQVIRDAVQAWILTQTSRNGVKIADLSSAWTDTSVLLQRLIPSTGQTYYDELNDVGAYLAALVVLPILQSMVVAGSQFNTDPTVNNLMPNYAFVRTTGGTTTTGVTGQMADGWTGSRISGDATAVASLEAIGVTGRNKQVFTATAGAAATRFRLGRSNLTFASAGLVDGDWVRMFVYVEHDGWAGWTQVAPKIDMQGTGRVIASFAAFAASDPGTPGNPSGARITTGAWGMWLQSEPTQIRAGLGLTSFKLTETMDFYVGAVAGSGVLKIHSPILLKITNPAPAWNLP